MTIDQLKSIHGIEIDRGQLETGFTYESGSVKINGVPSFFRYDVGPRIEKPPITEDLTRFQPKGKDLSCQAGGRVKKPRNAKTISGAGAMDGIPIL